MPPSVKGGALASCFQCTYPSETRELTDPAPRVVGGGVLLAGQLAAGCVSSPLQPCLAPGAPHPPEPVSPAPPPPASRLLPLPEGRLKSEGLCPPSLSLVINPRACPQDALHKHLKRPLSLHLSSFIPFSPATMVTLLRVPPASVHCSGVKIHTLPCPALTHFRSPHGPTEASWAQSVSPSRARRGEGKVKLCRSFQSCSFPVGPLHAPRRRA